MKFHINFAANFDRKSEIFLINENNLDETALPSGKNLNINKGEPLLLIIYYHPS